MKTKHVTSYMILVCAILAVLTTTAIAQDASVSTNLDAAYVSKYVWRGIPQTTGSAFQPSLTLSGANGLSFNFWASQDSDLDEVTENDYTLNYSWSGSSADMSAGYIYYAFPNTTFLSTSEIYVSAGFDGPLSPTLAINYDIDEASGFYASLSGSHSCALGKGSTSLDLSGRIGLSSGSYNNYWFGTDSTALSDLYLSASVPFAVGKITLTPSLSYSTLMSSKLRNSPTMNGLKSNNFVGGLTASLAF